MSVYRLSAMAVVAIATAMASAPSVAEEKQKKAQIETKKVEGTDNVYTYRNGNSQSMFIVTKAGVIATDPASYNRPTGAQSYIDEIRKITQAPIRYLIYSHHHLDHIAGGKAFKDQGAVVIAHRNARKRLAAINHPNTPLPEQVIGNYGEV